MLYPLGSLGLLHAVVATAVSFGPDPGQGACENGYTGSCGGSNSVQGHFSVAFGQDNTIQDFNGYTSFQNVAMGYGNKLIGAPYSTAIGHDNTITQTDYAVALGDSNNVTGFASFAANTRNVVSGRASAGFGSETVNKGDYALVVGNSITSTEDECVAASGSMFASAFYKREPVLGLDSEYTRNISGPELLASIMRIGVVETSCDGCSSDNKRRMEFKLQSLPRQVVKVGPKVHGASSAESPTATKQNAVSDRYTDLAQLGVMHVGATQALAAQIAVQHQEIQELKQAMAQLKRELLPTSKQLLK